MPRLIAVAMLSGAVLLALAIAIPTAPIEVPSSTPEATSPRRTGTASAQPAAKPRSPVSGCSEYPTQEWEKQATAVIGSVSFVIALADAWVAKNRIYHINHWRDHLTVLLLVPGCYALLIGMKAYLGQNTIFGGRVNPSCSSAVKVLFGDLTAILCAKYLYDLTSFELQLFNLRHGGFGSTAEAIERVGQMLEDMDLPPVKLPLSAVPCWGHRYFKPGRAFLTGCRKRMRFYTITAVTLLVVKQMVQDYNSFNSLALPVQDTAALWLGIAFIFAVMVAQSAKGPLEALILPFVTVSPTSQKAAQWRKLQYFLLFVVATGFNAIITLATTSPRPACMWWARHNSLFIVSILFVVVVIGHRCWVPPFHWSLSRKATTGLAQVWELIFEAVQKSTGSHDRMMAIRELFEVGTSLHPDVAREVHVGNKDLSEARQEAIERVTEVLQRLHALKEKGELWTSGKTGFKGGLDFGSVPYPTPRTTTSTTSANTSADPCADPCPNANKNENVTASPVVEDPAADILSPTRRKLLPADQEQERTMSDKVVTT